jgi:hypothetical protein
MLRLATGKLRSLRLRISADIGRISFPQLTSGTSAWSRPDPIPRTIHPTCLVPSRANRDALQRGFAEFVGAFTLIFVVSLDIFMGGPFTGAAMNPARAFGPELVQNVWSDGWVYYLGPAPGRPAADEVEEPAPGRAATE